jgi:hypothetical protein
MDPQQFDALSRTFAHASSRREAMARVGAAGLLAGLVTAFGRGRSKALSAAQGETCRLAIVATVRLGPDATERMQTDVPGELRGELSFTLGPDGVIDAGRLLLDGATEAPVVGQATGHALNLRADLQAIQEGLALVLVGTAQEPLSRCTGDWHATATAGGTGTTPPTPVPAPPSQQSCLPGLTRCGSACVDLGSDLNNCGACGSDCPAPFSCIEGACRCPGEFGYSCTGVCIDLGSDPANCGSCGNVCGAERSCINGFCLGSCEPGFTLCNSGCADLNSDPINCGQCGAVCGGGDAPYACSGGQCVLVDCAGGMEYCGAVDLCRDLSSDPAHCGACGNACPSGFCSGGVCQSVPIANIPLNEAPPDGISSCLPGLVYCGNGICVDIYIDSFNCGGCGITCPFPQGCQGGVCVG